jgi:hypothetical protein
MDVYRDWNLPFNGDLKEPIKVNFEVNSDKEIIKIEKINELDIERHLAGAIKSFRS